MKTSAARLALLLAAFTSLSLSACGGSNELSSAEAAEVSSAALTVSDETQTQLARELPALGTRAFQGQWVSGTVESFTVAGTITNPAGGTATVSGQGGEQGGWSVTLTVTFKAWVIPAGYPVNGSVTLTYNLGALAPLAFSAGCHGTVYLGEVHPLPVAIDLHLTMATRQLAVCGTVAGQPIAQGACH